MAAMKLADGGPNLTLPTTGFYNPPTFWARLNTARPGQICYVPALTAFYLISPI